MSYQSNSHVKQKQRLQHQDIPGTSKIRELLDRPGCRVIVQRVPRHCEVPGKELANKAAKKELAKLNLRTVPCEMKSPKLFAIGSNTLRHRKNKRNLWSSVCGTCGTRRTPLRALVPIEIYLVCYSWWKIFPSDASLAPKITPVIRPSGLLLFDLLKVILEN